MARENSTADETGGMRESPVGTWESVGVISDDQITAWGLPTINATRGYLKQARSKGRSLQETLSEIRGLNKFHIRAMGQYGLPRAEVFDHPAFEDATLANLMFVYLKENKETDGNARTAFSELKQLSYKDMVKVLRQPNKENSSIPEESVPTSPPHTVTTSPTLDDRTRTTPALLRHLRSL
jgi:hypothetical protein